MSSVAGSNPQAINNNNNATTTTTNKNKLYCTVSVNCAETGQYWEFILIALYDIL